MHRKNKLVPAVAAALLAAVPATSAIQDRLEAAERESLERAAQKVLQADADLATAEWRTYAAPPGKVWDKAVADAAVFEVEMQGDRAKIRVNESTTPYATDPSGKNPEATVPKVGTHVFLFEPAAGDGWRLVQDLTMTEL
ncbi:hypothetical protein ACFU5O_31040 [Streptomyces sp. NPDC057445]|uniref:hypothetical protein n=1 Tax=Streptomyces sp. NPDC057445 TaxID=3346136 RepID=UPI0036A9109B